MLKRLTRPARHIINAQDFREEDIERLFELTDKMRSGKCNGYLSDKIRVVCSLFYEPSTRTRFSFEAAAHYLGCRVISTEDAERFSSSVKGESLEDTIRVVSKYCDAIVLRHKEDDAAERAAAISSVPIINGGCGQEQHPTQAYLDLYTICSRFGRIEGRAFALVGDLLRGRTVRSLAYMLGRYEGVKIHFVSLPHLRIKPGIKEYLDRHNVTYQEHTSLEAVIDKVDVVYMTRLQQERPTGTEGYQAVEERIAEKKKPVLTYALAKRMRKDALILHPLPKTDEIEPEVDSLSQAVYYEQAENGRYVRMALLYMLFNDQ